MRSILVLFLCLCQAALAQNVVSLSPPNGGQTNSTQPSITATFDSGVSNARIWVDNTEFTGDAVRSGNAITLVPPYPLDYGLHHVRVRTSGLFGTHNDQNWAFYVVRENYNPYPNVQVTLRPTGSTFDRTPQITGSFPEPLQYANFRVDGIDLSSQARIFSNSISWTPNYQLDFGPHQAVIDATGASGRRYHEAWSFTINRSGQWHPDYRPEVDSYGPAPGTVVTVTRPSISASFTEPVRRLTLTVDGKDVTGAARSTRRAIVWSPGYDLDFGQHNVVVQGVSESGQPVRANWTFTIHR